MAEVLDRRDDQRNRIVEVAARILREQGATAVTTRGVAEAAGVQAPAIYRLFGDKDGLLEAVEEHVLATYVAAKAAIVRAAVDEDTDPLEDLRAGWRMQIDFGLANPALSRLFGDPQRAQRSPALRLGRQALQTRVHRVAAAGRLRVSEQRAVDLIQAAGAGTLQALLSKPPHQRDLSLADDMYQAVLAQIVIDSREPAVQPSEHRQAEDGQRAVVIAVRAKAAQLPALTHAERELLTEWLDRVIDDQRA